MHHETEQVTNLNESKKSPVRITLEDLYAVLWDTDLCDSMRDFSVYWLGKSPRYFSTLQSENGNGSFAVLLHAQEMMRLAILDCGQGDYDSIQYIKLTNAKQILDNQINEMQRNLIVE